MARNFWRIFVNSLSLAALLFSTGCARGLFSAEEAPDPRFRPPSSMIEAVDISIAKKDYISALGSSGSTNQIRLVQIFAREQDPQVASPEYRMFDIKKGSVYDMLGLQTGDVLVTANSYIVVNPSTFPQYVSLLRHEKTAQIEIRREGKPMLYRYTFTE